MKSRTLISFCRKPGSNPSQGWSDCAAAPSREMVGVAVMCVPFSTPSKRTSPQPEQRARVPGYHQLLVSRDDPRRDLAVRRGDSRPSSLVRLRVEFQPQPAGSLADAPAYLGRVLADPRGEDQPVHSAQDGGQRADLFGGAVDEVVHGEARFGL